MNAKLPKSSESWIDPDEAPELGADFFEQATPMVGGEPVSREVFAQAARATLRRGRPPKATPKVSTTIRFDADVLAALKATGPGWQTRANDALKAWLTTRR